MATFDIFAANIVSSGDQVLLTFGWHRSLDVVMLKWVLDELCGFRFKVGYALQFVLGIKRVGTAPSRSEFNDLWCSSWDIVGFHIVYRL